ncbi:MAG: biosynthetic peptidoglycan transglycosylase, partial [Acidaminococcaceae bacterium]
MKKYLFLLSVLLLVVFYAPGTSSEHPSAPQEQTLASATTMEAEVPGFFLALLPPPEEWPHPLAMLWRATHLHQAVKNQLTSADWVKLKQMAPSLPLAIVAVEDKRFYEHNGIDLDGIFRATLANIQADEIVQGGSTITQQLIKNVLLTSEQSWERKMWEASLALLAETNYTKDELLEMYLNTTYYGAGATGIKAASS